MEYNPLWALTIFFLLIAILWWFFRPIKGWFWQLKNQSQINEKIIIEDVLKQIYHFETSGQKVDMKTLIQILNYSNHKLIEALNIMGIKHLITNNPNEIKLTESGREYALRIVRVHRLYEKYLAEKTGFHKTEWHDMADSMEHHLSHEEADLLAAKLGHPQFDPHGDPIPTRSGQIAEISGTELHLLPIGSVGHITHIEDEPEVIYKQILAENIHIGSFIRVIENNPTRVVFESEGELFRLAPVVAANLTITLLAAEEDTQQDITRLCSLQKSEQGKIIGFSKEIRGESRRRLLDLGFVKGAQVYLDLLNPLGDPNAYAIKGTSIALRKEQADKILIEKI
jgi:DtxR family Mn-dependent transcriptional regulator